MGLYPSTAALCRWSAALPWRSKRQAAAIPLTGITRNGQPLKDDDTVTVTCLAAEKQMEALLASESGTSLDGDTWVKNTWRDYVSGGGAALAEPENYMTLR